MQPFPPVTTLPFSIPHHERDLAATPCDSPVPRAPAHPYLCDSADSFLLLKRLFPASCSDILPSCKTKCTSSLSLWKNPSLRPTHLGGAGLQPRSASSAGCHLLHCVSATLPASESTGRPVRLCPALTHTAKKAYPSGSSQGKKISIR